MSKMLLNMKNLCLCCVYDNVNPVCLIRCSPKYRFVRSARVCETRLLYKKLSLIFQSVNFVNVWFELKLPTVELKLPNRWITVYLVRRQTVLFSATQTRNVEDLARVSLKKSPLYVGVDDDRETSTVDGLEQVT